MCYARKSVAPFLRDGLGSFRSILANGLRVAAASAGGLHFEPLNPIAALNLNAHTRQRDSDRGTFLDNYLFRTGPRRAGSDQKGPSDREF